MAKPKDLVFGVDHLESNVLTEAEVAKIRALYNIPKSVKMRILGPLESLSNPKGEVVFFTDVFKHGLRLPLRHSVQKILAVIGYAPGQAEGALRSWGADLVENLASASGAGVWSLGIGVGSDCGEAYPHFLLDMSLKRPIAMKTEIEVMECVRSRIAKEGRVHKALLDYKNLYKASLISEPEYRRRKEEEEEERRSKGREMTDATRRRLQSRAPQKKNGSSRPKTKTPRQAEGASAQEGMPADRRREKRVAEAELIREAHLQVTGKRVIEGALDVTPLPKRPRGPNEEAAVLVSDEEDVEAEPVNIVCPRKANMEMWLGMKRAINAAERVQKNLSSRLVVAVEAEEARAAAEAAKEAELRSRAGVVEEAKKEAVEEYRSSPEFIAFLDKEVMVQCEDLIYRFKRFNADKKLNLNFLREPPPLLERVTEEMVEAYLGEDAEVDTSSDSESDSEEEEATPPPPALATEARDEEGSAPPAPATEADLPTP
ncbi:unnamed protein product [Prunus brigantina]